RDRRGELRALGLHGGERGLAHGGAVLLHARLARERLERGVGVPQLAGEAILVAERRAKLRRGALHLGGRRTELGAEPLVLGAGAAGPALRVGAGLRG